MNCVTRLDLIMAFIILVIACVVYLFCSRRAPPCSLPLFYDFGNNLYRKKKRRNPYHADPYVDMLIRLNIETALRMTMSASDRPDELLEEISRCTRKESKLFTTTLADCTAHSPTRAIRELTTQKVELTEQIRRAFTAKEVRSIYLFVVEINKTIKLLSIGERGAQSSA